MRELKLLSSCWAYTWNDTGVKGLVDHKSYMILMRSMWWKEVLVYSDEVVKLFSDEVQSLITVCSLLTLSCRTMVLKHNTVPTKPPISALYALWMSSGPGMIHPPCIHSERSGVEMIHAHAPI